MGPLRLTGPIQTALRDLAQRALFDEAVIKKTFPGVSIAYIVCWRTYNHAIWGYHCMRSAYREREEKGEVVRPLVFEIIPEGNHFVSTVITGASAPREMSAD
jgi:hypothetical protein